MVRRRTTQLKARIRGVRRRTTTFSRFWSLQVTYIEHHPDNPYGYAVQAFGWGHHSETPLEVASILGLEMILVFMLKNELYS